MEEATARGCVSACESGRRRRRRRGVLDYSSLTPDRGHLQVPLFRLLTIPLSGLYLPATPNTHL